MSADSNPEIIRKSLSSGACFYLVKPLKMEEVKTLWQYVVIKNLEKFRFGRHDFSQFNNTININRNECLEQNTTESSVKRTRVFWNSELHQKFVDAIKQIGNNSKFNGCIL